MGKHLQRNDSIIDGNYPSCMCGIMHFLNYHHWQGVKKLLPHKKNGGRRRIRWSESPKTNSKNRSFGEVFIGADAEPLLVKQQSTDSIPASRRSGKSHIKSLNARKREESHRSWILSFPLQSWLHRGNSDQLEPSENYLGRMDTHETDSVVIPSRSGTKDKLRHGQIVGKKILYSEKSDMAKESSVNQNLMKANQLRRDIHDQQLNDCVDILEIFKVNKEFFLKILQDPDVRKNRFRELKNSNIKVRLTKSRSFPLANSSQARSIRPSTLKHKQNEVWFFLNEEKSVASTRAQKLEESKFEKDHYINSTTVDSGRTGSANNHGWNQLVINRFRDIKQKIKQALKESKRENGHKPVEEEYPKDHFGGRTSIDGTEISERLEITIGQEGNKIDGLNDNRRLQHVRRTSSLNESLDRYTQLFENAFGRETKYSHSRSLNLTSEEKVPSHARKSCRRNLSLPDLDSFSSFLNGASRFGMPIKTLVDHSTNKFRDNQTEPEPLRFVVDTDNSEPLEAVKETQMESSTVQRIESIANIEYSAGLTVDGNEKKTSVTEDILKDGSESRAYQEEEICVTEDSNGDLSEPNYESVIEPCFSDDLTGSAGFQKSEGSELDPQINEADPDISMARHFEPGTPENADFDYVRDVLEFSGFIDHDEQPWTWHSLDQPLSPSVFKEVGNSFNHNEPIEEEEAAVNFSHRQLLFDLVNETLVEMNEKSYTYFPRQFSLGWAIRRTPKGRHVSDEVWSKISLYLRLRPELDQSLDDVVSRDLGKGDGWMSLEWESEMVALELEDLIFDTLLDEAII